MASALLIVHGLVTVVLLGAISHQALAVLVLARGRPGSFFGRFCAVPCKSAMRQVWVILRPSWRPDQGAFWGLHLLHELTLRAMSSFVPWRAEPRWW
jgi:hypothetical protein